MLANAPGVLSCFWVPRWTPDGGRNPIRIQRLKDKLGDRSNASSEIEMRDVWGARVGAEGRGVRTIIEMVNHTRLDCVLGSTAIMRQGVAQATWHTHHRSAFGRPLDQQQLMANVLADLAVESEAATLAAMRLAQCFDMMNSDEHASLLARLLTPVVKYWTCKRAPQHAAESLECLGGAGYVEESDLPRLFRQSPLNGVWEGSGNVICLDVLRAIMREPLALDAYWAEVGLGLGAADGGADVGVAVGVGAAGPEDTMMVTEEPPATRWPAAGSVPMAAPSGMVGSATRRVDPTRSPAEVMATIASDCGAPATSGTVTRSRAVDTVGSMLVPGATGVPGPGSWLMTVPSG